MLLKEKKNNHNYLQESVTSGCMFNFFSAWLQGPLKERIPKFFRETIMVKFEVYLKTKNSLQLSLKLKQKAQHSQL